MFNSPSARNYLVVLVMMAVVGVPVALALATVQYPDPVQPQEVFASPYGYTISLLMFLVPIGVIGVWFQRNPDYHIERKAFWLTVGILAPLGFILDTIFGNSFFQFVNHAATLGINGPGVVFNPLNITWDIPVEEYGFYFLGFVAVLLIYIWNDMYWVAEYCHDDRVKYARALSQLVQFHWGYLVLAAILIVAALLFKWYSPHPYQAGFPGYFIFLVLLGLVPTFLFFNAAQPLINWRAFSQSLFVILFISLIWEATLGVPYQWWGYRYDQMMGITIFPWSTLPLEAVIVWGVVTWATVIFYEIIRIYLHMNTPAMQAFFGKPKPMGKRDKGKNMKREK